MHLYGYNGRAFKALSIGFQNQAEWLASEQAGTESQSGTLRVLGTVPWFYRCVTLRANALAKVPFAVYRNDTPLDESYPIVQNMRRVLWYTEASLLLYGAAYWLPLWNRVAVADFQWLRPPTMQLQFNDDNVLTGFKRRRSLEKEIVLSPEEVTYIWQPNLAAEQGPGISVGQVALDAANLARYSTMFAENFFANGAMPITVVEVPPSMSDEDRKYAENWFIRRATGIANAWKTLVLRAGIKAVTLSLAPREVMFPQMKEDARTEIANTFGVPITMLTAQAQVSTRVSEDRLSFYEETILPDCDLISQAFNAQALAQTGLRLEFHPQEMPIFQEDETARAQSLASMVTAGLPLDVAMRILGFSLPSGMNYQMLKTGAYAWNEDDEVVPGTAETTPEPKQLPAPPSATPDAIRQEVKRWQIKALKAFKSSGVASVQFSTDLLPPSYCQQVEDALAVATTAEQVRGAFKAAAIKLSTVRVTEEDIRAALDQWDDAMPDYAGMLDAQAIGAARKN